MHNLLGKVMDRGIFRVPARRSDKNYFMDSPAINIEMGHRILTANKNLSVDVKKPQHTMNVEIRDMAYLYVKVIPAVGGMPVGTNGRATLLLSGGIDSPVAGWMIAKRGVHINAVHFHSYPYTSDRAKEKVLDLARILSESCCGIRVHIVPFTKIQMEIHEKCPEEYTTLIMRRFMMRLADMLAQELYTHRKYGGSRVKQELLRRGIDRALAEEAAERLDKDELNRIILLLQTKYRNNLGDEKGIIRTKNSLLRLGYSYSDIRAAFESIENESF